ncbi:hypothetical protein BOTBODRAFT_37342 [Botryobasidium botryosum FD-172 SS1]|uniref:Uncharacterized protein n=1 Tax=Botryobasidium botryosum (strain FD-172 SS1) TaxID=930990 RepID=A0A067M0L5_BOTB1|nr:hypothetical protein BOTBODRAFT_37342 [Botryobasidium botryosum FD-172 SS1]
MDGIGSHFLDVVDRFSHTAASIRYASQDRVKPTGRFTSAVLSPRHWSQGIREANDGERKLFTIDAGSDISATAMKRRDVGSATPFKRAKDTAAVVVSPEEYLRAAMRLIDEYHSTSSSRSHILELFERSAQIKENIDSLHEALSKEQPAKPPPRVPQVIDNGASAKEEEARVFEMEKRVANARRQRDLLRKRLQSETLASTSASSASLSNTTTSDLSASPEVIREPARPSRSASSRFPHTKGRQTATKTTTPPSRQRQRQRQDDSIVSGTTTETTDPDPDAEGDGETDMSVSTDTTATRDSEEQETETETERGSAYGDDEEGEGEDDGDETIIIPARSLAPALTTQTLPPPPVPVPVPAPAPVAPVRSNPVRERAPASEPERRPPPSAVVQGQEELKPEEIPSSGGPRITPEIESLVVKIWDTVGDIIQPGHTYITTNGKGTDPPPKAADTLELLSTLTASSSTSGITTNALQILTAHVLLTLLSAPPPHSVPHTRIREIIAAVDLPGAANEKARAVYGCVARGLLKMDRSKPREAVVAFAE